MRTVCINLVSQFIVLLYLVRILSPLLLKGVVIDCVCTLLLSLYSLITRTRLGFSS